MEEVLILLALRWLLWKQAVSCGEGGVVDVEEGVKNGEFLRQEGREFVVNYL